MSTTHKSTKIEFANSLRGIAVLLVLVGHYISIFNSIKGAYVNFPPMDYFPFPWAIILQTKPISYAAFGPLAVAIFFLVSGFVIPLSVASLSNKSKGRTAFVIGRVFRIWPTYAIGLIVTVAALWLNSKLNNAEFYQPLVRIMANISLFRDWLGQTQIDGVVWTLEAEAKFYVFILIFWAAIGKGRLFPLAIITALALVAAPLTAAYSDTLGPNLTIANFIWSLPFLLFMSIGILFNYHYRKIISTKTTLFLVTSMYAAFVIVVSIQKFPWNYPSAYGTAILLFGALYFFARGWTGGPVIRFFAKISFPLYACHAALGYTGMAYMISLGVAPYFALAAQVVISVMLAWAIHKSIEEPTHNAGKRLGKKMMSITKDLSLSTKA